MSIVSDEQDKERRKEIARQVKRAKMHAQAQEDVENGKQKTIHRFIL